MPCSYRIEGDLLYLLAEGHYELEDFEKLVHRALADPACPDPATLLVDARRAEVNPSTGDLRDSARFVGSLGRRIRPRLALVVERDLHFGLGRMFAAFAERHGLNLGAFRDLDEARGWLAEAPPT